MRVDHVARSGSSGDFGLVSHGSTQSWRRRRVVQRLTCYGTHQGEFPGTRPTGQQVTFQAIEISRAGADGKFTEHWSSIDVPAVLRLLSAPHRT